MLKIGIIGLGYWGPKHARNFHQLLDADLAWACDLRQDRLDHIQELYPEVQTTTSFRRLLNSDVDAVVIATPVSTHHLLAMEALRAGKHVLVEKPLAVNSIEAEELVEEGKRQNRVVMVGHTFEFNPAVEAVKQIIDSGTLGEIYYINATRVNLGLFQSDINVIWDLAPHDLSILRFILGMDPVAVNAQGEVYVQKQRQIHDVAYLTLRYPNQILANIRVSWLDPHKIRRYTIVGSKKMLVYDDIADDKILIYDKGVDVPPYSDTEEEFRLSYRYGDVTVHPVDWVEPLRKESQHFVECILTNKEPRSSGKVGLSVVKTLEAAQKSLLNGNGYQNIVYSKRRHNDDK